MLCSCSSGMSSWLLHKVRLPAGMRRAALVMLLRPNLICSEWSAWYCFFCAL
jgi:hypothetical protein